MKKIIICFIFILNVLNINAQSANTIIESKSEYSTEYIDLNNQYVVVSIDGVLYGANRYSLSEPSILIRYPSDKEETEYHIPYYVSRICANAFDNVTLDKLYIPSTIRYISYDAFKNSHIKKFECDDNLNNISTTINENNNNELTKIYNLNGIEVNEDNLISNNIYIIKLKNKSFKIKLE